MSLQKRLENYIELNGYITFDEMESLVREINQTEGEHFKMKTAERVLNPSKTSNVKTVHNEKSQIKGYKWIGEKTSNVAYKNPQPSLINVNY